MKREDLKGLGIADEVIEKVMAMYGKGIESIKGENEQLKVSLGAKEKVIEEANKTIDSFKGMKVEDIQKQAEEYKTKYEQSKGEFEKTLTETKKRYALELEIGKLGVKNPNSFKKLLELEKINFDGEKLVGLDEQVKGLKESEPYLFNEAKPNQVGTQPNLPNASGYSELEAEMRKAAGLPITKK